MTIEIVLSNPQSIFMRNQELYATKIDEELVMLDEQNGLYFALNSVASAIWELLKKPMSFQEIINTLMKSHDVTLKQCQQDVTIFLQEMLKHQLVVEERHD